MRGTLPSKKAVKNIGEFEARTRISSFQTFPVSTPKVARHRRTEESKDETTADQRLPTRVPFPLLAATVSGRKWEVFQSGAADAQEVGALLGARQPPVSGNRCCHRSLFPSPPRAGPDNRRRMKMLTCITAEDTARGQSLRVARNFCTLQGPAHRPPAGCVHLCCIIQCNK